MRLSNKEMLIKTSITIISILAIIWFIIPFFTHGIMNIGNLTGIIVFSMLMVYGIFMGPINHVLAKSWGSILGKVVLSVLGLCAAVIFVLTVTFSAWMIKAANQRPGDNPTVVVLGCRVYGERASLMLIERLDAAYKYLNDNPSAVCILSGGKGPGEDISEAQCMYRYLAAKGIDEKRMYKEDKSTSTRENLAFSQEIIIEHALSPEIAIVTNEFHEYRSSKVAEALDLQASAISGRTAWWLFPTYYVRELYGIIYEWVF